MVLELLRAGLTYFSLFNGFLFTNLRIRFNELYNYNLPEFERREKNVNIYINTMSFFLDLLFWINVKVEGKKVDLKRKIT